MTFDDFAMISCDGKDQMTPETAQRVAAKMRRHGRIVQAYKCQVCGHWHVGQKVRRKRK